MTLQTKQTIDTLTINTIRTLAIDAIEQANSGHPGIAMGAAPMAYTLWAKEMEMNPANPDWINRDRFILSAGHGSALLYSMLHLFGYGLTMDELKNFRQWGARHRVIPNSVIPWGWKRPPAHLDRESPWPSGWRWQRGISPTRIIGKTTT